MCAGTVCLLLPPTYRPNKHDFKVHTFRRLRDLGGACFADALGGGRHIAPLVEHHKRVQLRRLLLRQRLLACVRQGIGQVLHTSCDESRDIAAVSFFENKKQTVRGD